MKKAVVILLLAVLAFGCSTGRDQVLLEGTATLAQEDAFKSEVLIGTSVKDGLIDILLKKNPGSVELKDLQAEVADSSRRSAAVARRMIDIIETTPKLSEDSKTILISLFQEALKKWERR